MKLGNIISLVRGNTYKSALLSETEGPVLLGLGSIQRNGGFKCGTWKRYPGNSDSRILLHLGDLYVSLKDLTQSCDLLGAVARVPLDMSEGRLTQDTVKLEFNPGLDAKTKLYTYWSLRTPQYRAYCKARGTGTTNMSLSRNDFLGWDIPAQSEARDVLVNLFELIELKIEANIRLNGYLEELFDSYFKQSLNMVDETWDTASLLDIADYKNGLAMQKFRPNIGDKGLPVLKIRELGQESSAKDAERCRSDIDESVTVHDGDLVFSWSGTLLLRFWAGGDAGLNQHLFKVTSGVYPSWFYYAWTKHHLARFTMLAKDRATTMGHIKRSALEESEVLLPPKEKLAMQTKCMQPIIDQVIANKIEIRKLAALRDTLLPKLMSGEIDVSKIDLTQLNSHLTKYFMFTMASLSIC